MCAGALLCQTPRVRWQWYGEQALLIHFAAEPGEESLARARVLREQLERRPPRGLREYVLAFCSVLLDFLPGTRIDPEAVMADLQAAPVAPLTLPEPIIIPVIYDGPDLYEVAAAAGVRPGEVAAIHSAPRYHVHALGFSPGFPYLGPLDVRLRLPRRAHPRASVPAGAVALGGSHAGIYPVSSPGGWHLIGRTAVRLFRPELRGEEAFLLRAGDTVRFVEVPADEEGSVFWSTCQ